MTRLDPSNELGSFIRNVRKDKKLSVTELARKIGKTPAHISQIELNCQRHPLGYETTIDIANALEINLDELLVMAGHTPIDIQRKLHEKPAIYFPRVRGFND